MSSSGEQVHQMDPKPKGLKRKHLSLTIYEKVEVLKKLDSGVSARKVCDLYGISSSTVYDIKKQKEKILKFYQDSDSKKEMKVRKTMKDGRSTEHERKVMEWLRKTREDGLEITGNLIKEQAKVLHQELRLDHHCEYSDGWLQRFKKRHGIVLQKIAGKTKTPATENDEDEEVKEDEEEEVEEISEKNLNDFVQRVINEGQQRQPSSQSDPGQKKSEENGLSLTKLKPNTASSLMPRLQKESQATEDERREEEETGFLKNGANNGRFLRLSHLTKTNCDFNGADLTEAPNEICRPGLMTKKEKFRFKITKEGLKPTDQKLSAKKCFTDLRASKAILKKKLASEDSNWATKELIDEFLKSKKGLFEGLGPNREAEQRCVNNNHELIDGFLKSKKGLFEGLGPHREAEQRCVNNNHELIDGFLKSKKGLFEGLGPHREAEQRCVNNNHEIIDGFLKSKGPKKVLFRGLKPNTEAAQRCVNNSHNTNHKNNSNPTTREEVEGNKDACVDDASSMEDLIDLLGCLIEGLERRPFISEDELLNFYLMYEKLQKEKTKRIQKVRLEEMFEKMTQKFHPQGDKTNNWTLTGGNNNNSNNNSNCSNNNNNNNNNNDPIPSTSMFLQENIFSSHVS